MPRLLLVDDTPANLLALEAALSPLDQELVSVTSGSAALEEVARGEFALAIIDVMMPVMDGIETARQMKRIAPKLPVLIVTALDIGERRSEAYAAGGFDYIVKPLDPYALRIKASMFVEFQLCKDQVRELQKRLAAASEALASAEAQLAAYQSR